MAGPAQTGLWAAGPLAAAATCLIAAFAPADDSSPPPSGLHDQVAFNFYTPLSSNAEMARRLLSPLTAARIPLALSRSGKVLAEQPIDLSRETFMLYVPPVAPLGGYGLMVFVPPWEGEALPQGWASVLDRHGMILVSAARSGNAASPMSRREPLALLAAANVKRLYPVDPSRTYIGGLSGGSRVALRLALGYPDLFAGALLNAGSDPIGDEEVPLPPADLFARFQASSRLVYVTGARDAPVLENDEASIASMRRWCVFSVDALVTPLVGHEAASPAALSRALDWLSEPARPESARLAQCRSRIAAALAAGAQRVRALSRAGKAEDARKLSIKLDRDFGGLATADGQGARIHGSSANVTGA